MKTSELFMFFENQKYADVLSYCFQLLVPNLFNSRSKFHFLVSSKKTNNN